MVGTIMLVGARALGGAGARVGAGTLVGAGILVGNHNLIGHVQVYCLRWQISLARRRRCYNNKNTILRR